VIPFFECAESGQMIMLGVVTYVISFSVQKNPLSKEEKKLKFGNAVMSAELCLHFWLYMFFF
jgi:hypothetical protein